MPVTISGGSFGSNLTSDPDAQKTQVNQAKKDLDDLQRQIAAGELRKGSKDVMEELNRLEKMGIATFGTGLRGLDTAGSGDKPYTRQQYQRLVNALYDPSQRNFDQDTIYPNQFAASQQKLTSADYEDYLKGRDARLKDTWLGKGIGYLQGVVNPFGSGIKAAQDFLGGIMPSLQRKNPEYFSYLQKGLAPQNENNLENRYAGILGLQVPQNMTPLNNNVPAGALSGFQLASNPVNYKNPVVASNASDVINSNQLFPRLNYPTFNTLA